MPSATLIEFQKPIVFALPKPQQLRDLIQAIALILQQAGITPCTQCVFCVNDATNTFATINGVRVAAHQDCKVKAIDEATAQNAQKDDRDPEVLKGTVGALFGAILGSIPWILIDWFIGGYAAVVAILIGMSALYFYQKFGGRVIKLTRLIIILATLFGVLFANFMIATLLLVTNDALLVIDNYIVIYTDPELAPLMLQSLAIGVFISIFSFPYILQKVKSKEKQTVNIH